jgi:hypothetical protein
MLGAVLNRTVSTYCLLSTDPLEDEGCNMRRSVEEMMSAFGLRGSEVYDD